MPTPTHPMPVSEGILAGFALGFLLMTALPLVGALFNGISPNRRLYVSKNGPVEWDDRIYCPPGVTKKVLLKNQASLLTAQDYGSCKLTNVAAPDWIKAAGEMKSTTTQGPTHKHTDVDFHATVEVLESAPRGAETKIVFTFANPDCSKEVTVVTAERSTWDIIGKYSLRGAIGGLILAVVGGFLARTGKIGRFE